MQGRREPASGGGSRAFPDLDALVGKLDLETKVRLCPVPAVDAGGPPTEIGLRSMTCPTARSACAAAWTPSSSRRQPALGLGHGGHLGRGPARADRRAAGREAVRKGVDVVLGPTINLHRSPLGGRHFECFSEDPLLTGRLATAYVRGVQERGVGACPKHYVANDAETDRITVDNRVDERTLRELYLAPFEAVVADAAAVDGHERPTTRSTAPP